MSKKYPSTKENIIVILLVIGTASGACSSFFQTPGTEQCYLWLTVICFLTVGALKLPQWIVSTRSKFRRRKVESYHPEDVAAVCSLLSRSNRADLQAINKEPNPDNWSDFGYLRLDWEGRPYLRVKSLFMDGGEIDGFLELPPMPELQCFSLIGNPRLTALKGLENLPKLDALWINNTGLRELNLSGNPALATLMADRIKLAALDLSGNPELQQLNLSHTRLVQLNLNGLTKLWHLDVSSPHLARLEMSSLPALRHMYLVCPALREFNLISLPVLDELILEASIKKIDLSCTPQLRRLILYKSPIDELNLEYLPGLKILNLSDLPLTELLLEQNSELETLCLSNLSLCKLYIACNAHLKWIEFKSMPLSSIDVFNIPRLENLYLRDLPMPAIDVSANSELSTLEISAVPITSLNVSANTKLKRLSVNKTGLTELDVAASPKLTWLDVSANPLLTSLDVSRSKNLAYLMVQDSPLKSLDLSRNKQLLWLLASRSSLTELDLTHNKRLQRLAVGASGLKRIKIVRKLQMLYTDQEAPTMFTDHFPGTDFLSWKGKCSGLVEWLSSSLRQTLATNYRIANLNDITADINVDLDDLPAEPLLAGRAYLLSELSPKLEADLLRAKNTGQPFALLSLGSIDLNPETWQLTFHDEGIQQLKLVLDGRLKLRVGYNDNFNVKK